VPPRERNPAVPPELSHLILRLLAKKPDDRPTRAAVVATVLTTLLQRVTGTPAAVPLAAPVAPPVPAPPPVLREAPPPAPPSSVSAVWKHLDEPGETPVPPAFVPARMPAVRASRRRIGWALGVAGAVVVVVAGVLLAVLLGGRRPGDPPADGKRSSPLDALDPTQIAEDERRPWHPRQLVGLVSENRQRGGATHLAWAPDGKALAVAFSNGDVCLWDFGGTAPVFRARFNLNDKAAINDLRYLSDGSGVYVLAGSRALLLDAGAELTQRASLPVTTPPTVAPNGSLMVRTEGNQVVVQRIEGRRVTEKLRLPAFQHLAFAPDNRIVAGRSKTELVLWDVGGDKEKLVGHWPHDCDAKVTLRAFFAPDGQTLYSFPASGGGPLHAWDVSLWCETLGFSSVSATPPPS
jgi:hypothetical protein